MVFQAVFVSLYIGCVYVGHPSFEKCWGGFWPPNRPNVTWKEKFQQILLTRHLRVIGFCWAYWWPNGTWDIRRKTWGGWRNCQLGSIGLVLLRREPPCKFCRKFPSLFFRQKRLQWNASEVSFGWVFLPLTPPIGVYLTLQTRNLDTTMWLGKPCWCSSNCRCATPGFRIDSYLWGGWKQEPPSFDKSIELFPVASPMKHHATERRDVWWFLLYHPMVDFLLYSSWLTWTQGSSSLILLGAMGFNAHPMNFRPISLNLSPTRISLSQKGGSPHRFKRCSQIWGKFSKSQEPPPNPPPFQI